MAVLDNVVGQHEEEYCDDKRCKETLNRRL